VWCALTARPRWLIDVCVCVCVCVCCVRACVCVCVCGVCAWVRYMQKNWFMIRCKSLHYIWMCVWVCFCVCECVCVCVYVHTYTHKRTFARKYMYFFLWCFPTMSTGWRRCIGCLIFISRVHHNSPILNHSFVERDVRLKAPYASFPPFNDITVCLHYGVATISRLLNITSLFCKRAL